MNIKRFDSAQLPPGLALATGSRAFARSETPCAGSLVHALNKTLPADALHEVFATKPIDRASGWGFALLLAARLAAGRSLFFVRQGRRGQGRLYPPGLAELGMDPELCFQLHAPDTLALLRATADIARSGAAGAVLAEIEGNPRLFDLTASRRLALAAEKSGTAVLLLRVAAHEEPGAAYSRWGVVSAASTPLLADAPGPPAFAVTLLRHRRMAAGQSARLAWNTETRTFYEQAFSPAPQRDSAGEATFGRLFSLAARRAADPRQHRAA